MTPFDHANMALPGIVSSSFIIHSRYRVTFMPST